MYNSTSNINQKPFFSQIKTKAKHSVYIIYQQIYIHMYIGGLLCRSRKKGQEKVFMTSGAGEGESECGFYQDLYVVENFLLFFCCYDREAQYHS